MMRFAAFKLLGAAALLAIAAMSGCRYRPGGTSLIFHIKTDKEFNVWRMERPESTPGQRPIQLKWYDTSTYVTYDKMPPGPYVLAVRRNEGGFYRIEFTVEPDKWYYEFDDPSAGHGDNSGTAQAGPTVKAQIDASGRKLPDHCVFIFAAKEVETRRVGVQRHGIIEAQAPRAGKFRIEIIEPGEPPRTWSSDFIEVNDTVDLGKITLR